MNCPICKNDLLESMPTCLECHEIYWLLRDHLTNEQHDEIQIKILKKQELPLWFDIWWKRMQAIKAFW